MRTPDSWETARATAVIAAIVAGAYLLAAVVGIDQWAFDYGAFVPADWSLGTNLPWALLTPLTATLLHANLLHIGFNLLIHLFCGRAVEGALGPAYLVLLFVVGAYAAAAGQFAFGPLEATPMIGASGAISAIIGAYAMLFGKNRVRVGSARLGLWLNTLWLLVAWVGIQLMMGIALRNDGVLLAVGAHIGGFVAGLLLARPLLLYRYRNA